MEFFYIYLISGIWLVILSIFIPNASVSMKRIEEIGYGTPRFHYESRNCWISYLCMIAGAAIVVGTVA